MNKRQLIRSALGLAGVGTVARAQLSLPAVVQPVEVEEEGPQRQPQTQCTGGGAGPVDLREGQRLPTPHRIGASLRGGGALAHAALATVRQP